MRKPKINKKRLHAMLKNDMNYTQCAKEFNCSVSAVSQRAKDLRVAIAKDTTMEAAHDIVTEELGSMALCNRASAETLKLVDLMSKAIEGDPDAVKTIKHLNRLNHIGDSSKVNAASAKDPRDYLLKALAEVRQQIRLNMDIANSLSNWEAVAIFQREVINIISEVAPDVRKTLLERLKAHRAVRQSIRIT